MLDRRVFGSFPGKGGCPQAPFLAKAFLEKEVVHMLHFSPKQSGHYHDDMAWRGGMRKYSVDVATDNRDTITPIHEVEMNICHSPRLRTIKETDPNNFAEDLA